MARSISDVARLAVKLNEFRGGLDPAEQDALDGLIATFASRASATEDGHRILQHLQLNEVVASLQSQSAQSEGGDLVLGEDVAGDIQAFSTVPCTVTLTTTTTTLASHPKIGC